MKMKTIHLTCSGLVDCVYCYYFCSCNKYLIRVNQSWSISREARRNRKVETGDIYFICCLINMSMCDTTTWTQLFISKYFLHQLLLHNYWVLWSEYNQHLHGWSLMWLYAKNTKLLLHRVAYCVYAHRIFERRKEFIIIWGLLMFIWV